MAKKITGYVKLQVPAGAANPSPPIGPALGQRGLNIMEFCKAFNARTAQMEKGTPIPVVITAYQDRSFTFEMKLPPVSYFLKKASGVTSGSKTHGPRLRRQGHEGADPGDRRKETAGSELRDGRRRDDDDRGLRPFDGPRGGRVSHGAYWKTRGQRPAKASTASSFTRSSRLSSWSRSGPMRNSTKRSKSP